MAGLYKKRASWTKAAKITWNSKFPICKFTQNSSWFTSSAGIVLENWMKGLGKQGYTPFPSKQK